MRGLITESLSRRFAHPFLTWQFSGCSRGPDLLFIPPTLCRCCSALRRRARGKLPAGGANREPSIFAKVPSAFNPLWLQREHSVPSTSSWGCPALRCELMVWVGFFFFLTRVLLFVYFLMSVLFECPVETREEPVPVQSVRSAVCRSSSPAWHSQLWFSPGPRLPNGPRESKTQG